jgi:hypothetical protein
MLLLLLHYLSAPEPKTPFKDTQKCLPHTTNTKPKTTAQQTASLLATLNITSLVQAKQAPVPLQSDGADF